MPRLNRDKCDYWLQTKGISMAIECACLNPPRVGVDLWYKTNRTQTSARDLVYLPKRLLDK